MTVKSAKFTYHRNFHAYGSEFFEQRNFHEFHESIGIHKNFTHKTFAKILITISALENFLPQKLRVNQFMKLSLLKDNLLYTVYK